MKTAELQQHEQVPQTKTEWLSVCGENDLVLSSGVCALIPSEKLSQQQLAIFRVKDSANEVQTYAVANWDPIGKANVISRGILGSINGEIVVSSPLYKQHFSLLTGLCIEDPTQHLTVYETRFKDGSLLVKVA